VAQKIFGRAGTQLLPLLAQGVDGMAALKQEAHDLGIVFDQEAADKAANFNDALHRMKEALSGVKMAIAEELIPVLMPLITRIQDIISGFTAWSKEHAGLTKVIIIASTALGGLLVVFGGLLLIMPGLTSALAAFGITLHLALGPIGLVILGITALVAAGIALWKNWDKVVHFFKMAWAEIKIFFLRGVENVLKTLEKFTSFIPILGDKVKEAREAISNMIEAEKVERDLLRVERAVEVNVEKQKKAYENLNKVYEKMYGGYKDAEQAVEDYTEAIDPELIKAHQKEQEELENTQRALRELNDERKTLLDRADRAIKQYEYERSEAGKLRITTNDVTNTLIAQGWKTGNLALLWKTLGDDVDYANLYLNAAGLTIVEITEFINKQREAVDGLRNSYEDLAKPTTKPGGLPPGVTTAPSGLFQGALGGEAETGRAQIKNLVGNLGYAAYGGWGGRRGADYAEWAWDNFWNVLRERTAPMGGAVASQMQATARSMKDELMSIFEGSIPLAEGGIAMRPMLARIGEQAPRIPEAVIPLDKLEMMLGGAGGKLVNIFVELDGRTIAKVIGQPLVSDIRLKTGVRI